MCRLSWNLEASTSWYPQGLFRPVMGLLYLYHKIKCVVHFWWHWHHKCCFYPDVLLKWLWLQLTEDICQDLIRTLSTRRSCMLCDLKFWKLIDNELAKCWIGRAGTVSDLWGHMTLPTRKVSVDICHGVDVHSLASKGRWRKFKILFPTVSPVNISVLSSTWQQFECNVDVCQVNGSTHWEYL
jgi:hypothetical protein